MNKMFVYVSCEIIKRYKDKARIRIGSDGSYITVRNNMLLVLKDNDYAVRARRDWSKNNKGTLNILINTIKGTERRQIAIDDIVVREEAITH